MNEEQARPGAEVPTAEDNTGRRLSEWHPHYVGKREKQLRTRERRKGLQKLQQLAAQGDRAAQIALGALYSRFHNRAREVAGTTYSVDGKGTYQATDDVVSSMREVA